MQAVVTSTFSARLKNTLEESGMRQTDLCERAGIGKSAMSQYLHGAFIPKQAKLSAIAEALGVSEGWLMGYDVPRKRAELPAESGVLEVVASNQAMRSAHIPGGSILKVRQVRAVEQIENGRIVCFTTDDTSKLVRYYNKSGDVVVLTAADPGYEPIVVSIDAIERGEVVIHGVVDRVEIKL